MKVILTDYTHDAVNKLIATKATRLSFAAAAEKVASMSEGDKFAELEYMSRTIPSSWEFVNYTFQITDVSRAFTHQFVRSRLFSFAQQSMRVQPMDGFGFLVPDGISSNPVLSEIYNRIMGDIDAGYNELIQAGAATEDARGVLPTNIHTNIAMHCNLRSISELVRKRSSGRVQGEYRKVLDGMKDEIYRVHPWAHMFMEPQTMQRCTEAENNLNEILAMHPDDKNENNMEPAIYTNVRKFIDYVRGEFS